MRFLKVGIAVLLSVFPSRLKILLYRLIWRYQIGTDVRIGFGSAFVDVRHCRIGDHVRMGCFNLFLHIHRTEIADYARIGYLNLFRGGERVRIGAKVSILRLNVFNSILRPDAVTPFRPELKLGPGVVVTTGHWLDFTDRIAIDAETVIGGRNSSFWTHSRQRTRPIAIGPRCYLGSEVRLAPGVEIPSSCIVALGSVLTGRFTQPRALIAGNPGSVRRPLSRRELFLVTGTGDRHPSQRLPASAPPDTHQLPAQACHETATA